MANVQPADVEVIARAVVEQLAPEELPYFASATAQFRRDPAQPPRVSGGDDALGFGEVVGLALSPFALWLTQELLSFVAGQVRPTLARATLPLRSRIRRFFARIPGLRRWVHAVQPVVSTTQLSPAELAAVRAACLDRATAVGLPAETAELLTDAIIGRLVLAS